MPRSFWAWTWTKTKNFSLLLKRVWKLQCLNLGRPIRMTTTRFSMSIHKQTRKCMTTLWTSNTDRSFWDSKLKKKVKTMCLKMLLLQALVDLEIKESTIKPRILWSERRLKRKSVSSVNSFSKSFNKALRKSTATSSSRKKNWSNKTRRKSLAKNKNGKSTKRNKNAK